MKSVKLSFEEKGVQFDFSAPVEDFANEVQTAMVNIATSKGSDPINPDKGTDLLKEAVAGRLINIRSAEHFANFAALDTLFLFRQFEDTNDQNRLAKVTLKPVEFAAGKLTLDAQFTSASNEVIGVLSNITDNA